MYTLIYINAKPVSVYISILFNMYNNKNIYVVL